MELVCVTCGKLQGSGYKPVCEECGSLTNPVYNLDKTRLRESDNPFERFADLLPLRDRSLLPRDAGYTPVVKSRNLGARFGLQHLYLKNETVLPTKTTKYRMAAVALPYLYECGVGHFCTSSTGNTSTAYASLLPNTPDLKMTLFTASDFIHRVNYREHPRISHFILDGASFSEAFDTAGAYARMRGHTSERGFFNPGRREGLKLAFFEAVDQLPRSIDCYVQAVSSAMGVFGTFSGARELLAMGLIRRLPRLLCIQQSSCAPMARAWCDGADSIGEEYIVDNPRGIAEAILRGNPSRVYPYVKEVVRESRGEIAFVSDVDIRQARNLLLDEEGIDVCFSAATAMAGLIRLSRQGLVSKDETILVNLTGKDRNHDFTAEGTWFCKRDNKWHSKQSPGVTFPATAG